MDERKEAWKDLIRQWLLKAEEDYGAVKELMENLLYPNIVGFHVQQACEKFLKSLLVYYQIEFGKTHNLDELLSLLNKANPALARKLKDAKKVSAYAVEPRYPGDAAELSVEELKKALEIAIHVRKTVLSSLKRIVNLKA